jgi:putative endopeptidase
MQLNRLVYLILLCPVFYSCNNASVDSEVSKKDFLAANLDTAVSPSNDFFMYANGGWIKSTPIPGEESGWGVGNLVEEENYSRLRKINEDAAAHKAAEGTIEQKVGDFWFSGMDSISIDQQQLKPLKADIDEINAIKSVKDLENVTADLHRKGVHVMFSDYVAQDDKNSEKMVYQLGQGGLGMPNREYYFSTDKNSIQAQNAYKNYLAVTLEELGNDSVSAHTLAKQVYQLETQLASASRKRAELRDPQKNYNKMSLSKLEQLTPNFNWPNYLQKIGIAKLDSTIVGQPEFYSALDQQFVKTPLTVWKNYLQAHLVRSFSSFLDSTTYSNFFEYVQTLSGASKQRPRWKIVLDAEQDAMGEALGQLFVKEYFNATAKKRYQDLVEAIRSAYRDRISNLTWMSADTKKKALEKLDQIHPKLGYPDKWKDFSSLKIDRGPYVLNMERAREWWHNYNVNKLGKPVDRTEWDMWPQEYNAYYNPSNNEIVLPAGAFSVPGMRDEELDDAFVYGYAAASTIGHEITHGFDDQGRQYDGKGNLANWWTANDSTEFVKRARLIIKEYSDFIPIDTLHINGDATQGENIADLGGVLLGLDAFKKTEAYKSGKKIGGFTPSQRYFLGYAYAWMYQVQPKALAHQVMTDVHSPAKERVNGPLVNVPAFYDAFNVKPGDKMYRADSLRVQIW